MRVLLVENDPDASGALGSTLNKDGYAVDHLRGLAEASAALRVGEFALIVLDRRLPDGDGLTLLPEIHARQPAAAVIVLGAMSGPCDRVAGLDAGADDYLSKPFDLDELRARVRAALRRRPGAAARPMVCGRLMFRPDTREVSVDGNPLIMRRRELALVEALMLRARRVVQRDSLLRQVYAFEEEPSSNSLEAQISRLRARLRRAGAEVVIHPVRGVGYILDAR